MNPVEDINLITSSYHRVKFLNSMQLLIVAVFPFQLPEWFSTIFWFFVAMLYFAILLTSLCIFTTIFESGSTFCWCSKIGWRSSWIVLVYLNNCVWSGTSVLQAIQNDISSYFYDVFLKNYDILKLFSKWMAATLSIFIYDISPHTQLSILLVYRSITRVSYWKIKLCCNQFQGTPPWLDYCSRAIKCGLFSFSWM